METPWLNRRKLDDAFIPFRSSRSEQIVFHGADGRRKGIRIVRPFTSLTVVEAESGLIALGLNLPKILAKSTENLTTPSYPFVSSFSRSRRSTERHWDILGMAFSKWFLVPLYINHW